MFSNNELKERRDVLLNIFVKPLEILKNNVPRIELLLSELNTYFSEKMQDEQISISGFSRKIDSFDFETFKKIIFALSC